MESPDRGTDRGSDRGWRLKVVVIGNGIAGINAAEAMRSIQPDPLELEIEVHAKEPHGLYSRIRLPEAISAGLSVESIILHDDAWYAKRAIGVKTSHGAVSISTTERTVEFEDRSRTRYDALLLCTGSEPMVFDAPGVRNDGVLTLRHYEDAARIRERIGRGDRRVAVIGGGLLGIEAAHHLKLGGADSVTIVEIAPRLLPRQMDERGAAILSRILEGKGLRFRLGARVERYEGDGSLTAISLASGERIDADFALLSSGIKPNTELALRAGIPCGKGVTIDEYMETGAKDIYAAGDAAEFKGRVWGIIPAALDQAQAAARAILGDRSRPYAGTVPRTSLKVAGIDLLSVGLAVPESAEAEGLDFVVHEDADNGRYERFVLKNGALAGAIILGSKKNQGWAGSRIGKPVKLEEIPAL